MQLARREGKPENPPLGLPAAPGAEREASRGRPGAARCFDSQAAAETPADTSPALEMSQESCSARLLIKKPPAPVHFFTVFCKHTQLAQAYCLLSKQAYQTHKTSGRENTVLRLSPLFSATEVLNI